jgi:hypothetical protein
MIEKPLNLSLIQGKKFMQFQNNIKKTVFEHKNIKEGFETQQQNIIQPATSENQVNNNSNEDKKIILKINKMEKKYDHLMKQYKQELQNIKNKIDMSSNMQIVGKDDQIILENLRTQLSILGNDIATTMETLYTNNNEIYKQMNMNSEQFKKNIQMYKDVNARIQDINKEGMQNMSPRDLNSLVSDTDIYVLYENYNYVLWSILAITSLAVTIKLLK